MQTLLVIALLFLVIGIVVLVHEFGHFLFAKLAKIGVEEFAIGFGPVLWEKQYKGTHYQLRALPLGGFVKLEGDKDGASAVSETFKAKPLYAKVAVLAGGVFMNMVLAVILSAIYMQTVGYTIGIAKIADYQFIGTNTEQSYTTAMLVDNVLENSPAIGKLVGNEDVITRINGIKFNDSRHFQELLTQSQGQEIKLEVRNIKDLQRSREVQVVLGFRDTPESGLLLVNFVQVYVLNYPESPLSGIAHTLNLFGYQVTALAKITGTAVEERNPQIVAEQTVGFVGLSVFINDLVGAGAFNEVVNLAALINVGLAFFNILPLPALDGGHILVEVLESVRRKRFNPMWLERISSVGFIFLLLLSVLIIFKDLIQFSILEGVFSTIKSVLGR